MNIKSIRDATALIIAGYIHQEGQDTLAEVLAAIQSECDDWAANLTEPKADR